MKNNNSELTCWIGLRIKHFRKTSNLSQEQLAEATGLHRTYIGSCERGERNLTIVNLSIICNKLKVSLKDFFDDDIKKAHSD
jgi:transcriptional regulator with XRE-family HTH domain